MDLEKLAVEYVDFIASVTEASEPGSGVSLMGEYGALTGAHAILSRVNTIRQLGGGGQRTERWERFEAAVAAERERRAGAELTCERCGQVAPCRCWPTAQRRQIAAYLARAKAAPS